jgi:hypothetical protein
MILTFEEARKQSGRFQEFKYYVKVKRTKESEHFGCFKNNDDKEFVLQVSVYFWNEDSFHRVVSHWNTLCNGLLSMYKYYPIGAVSPSLYTPEQVVTRIYEKNKFNNLAHLITVGSIDYIM